MEDNIQDDDVFEDEVADESQPLARPTSEPQERPTVRSKAVRKTNEALKKKRQEIAKLAREKKLEYRRQLEDTKERLRAADKVVKGKKLEEIPEGPIETSIELTNDSEIKKTLKKLEQQMEFLMYRETNPPKKKSPYSYKDKLEELGVKLPPKKKVAVKEQVEKPVVKEPKPVEHRASEPKPEIKEPKVEPKAAPQAPARQLTKLEQLLEQEMSRSTIDSRLDLARKKLGI